jgi:uncharacterized protein YbjT (DUF2867 family)
VTRILVTGGTGGLGRPTVVALRAAKHDVIVLSRKSGDGRVVGDLTTGIGIADALRNVDTIVHLATTRSAKDSGQTRVLLEAARAAGVAHILFISIVGVDRIPYAYYRDKVVSEALIEGSGIPYTILRATQFHDFLAGFLSLQRRLPVLLALNVPFQPIAVEEVAHRLAELVDAPPAGRVADIGGPETKPMSEFAAEWQSAHGTSKPVWMLRIPGKTIRALKAGHHTTSLPGYGTATFAQYAAANA